MRVLQTIANCGIRLPGASAAKQETGFRGTRRLQLEHLAQQQDGKLEQTMENILKLILFLTGCVIVWLGLNVGLGGIETLGWQGATNFFSVTDPEVFAVQDNHVRFIAGVWMTVGVLIIVSAFALRAMRKVLIALMVMIFAGGLMRFSAGNPALLSSLSVAPSLIAELILFPLLVMWIQFTTKEQSHA